MAWVLRSIERISNGRFKWLKKCSHTGPLRIEEFKASKRVLLQFAQQNMQVDYQRWIPSFKKLQKKKKKMTKDYCVVKKRKNEEQLSSTAMNPTFIPRKHKVIEFSILHVHQEAAHIRSNTSLTSTKFLDDKG